MNEFKKYGKLRSGISKLYSIRSQIETYNLVLCAYKFDRNFRSSSNLDYPQPDYQIIIIIIKIYITPYSYAL